MPLPNDSLVQHALNKMNARLAERSENEQNIYSRSGVLFTGNIHDTTPRRLILDTRLSSQDKVAWMIIRLYALSNEGAVFPSYEELQLQLAKPGKGRASKETISYVLLMLRMTGWLSLCKRVRDQRGVIRGNIYAQHDEPLSFADAETFDPQWLKTVIDACFSSNHMVSSVAKAIISEVQLDPDMGHHKTHLQMIESRLGAAQSPADMAQRAALKPENQPGSDSEPGIDQQPGKLGSESEPSQKPRNNSQVRNPNSYVRNFSNTVSNTYVNSAVCLPEAYVSQLPAGESDMLNQQLQALPADQAELVLKNVNRALQTGGVSNPVGWLLAVLKKARNGRLYDSPVVSNPVENYRPERQAFPPQAAEARKICDKKRCREMLQNARAEIEAVRK